MAAAHPILRGSIGCTWMEKDILYLYYKERCLSVCLSVTLICTNAIYFPIFRYIWTASICMDSLGSVRGFKTILTKIWREIKRNLACQLFCSVKNIVIPSMSFRTYELPEGRAKAGEQRPAKPVNLRVFLKPLDQNEYLVPLLNDLLHIRLEPAAQVHCMTFNHT